MRSTACQFAAMLAVIALGLTVRRLLPGLHPELRKGVPDALWATLVLLLGQAVFRRARTLQVAAGAMAVAALVETGQLYHAAWIDAWRATLVGGLVLGFGFRAADLAWYGLGILFGVGLTHMAGWYRGGDEAPRDPQAAVRL